MKVTEARVKRYPHGERGEFRKVTVTLPPNVYALLVKESGRRKIAREDNHMLAAIVREAVEAYLPHQR